MMRENSRILSDSAKFSAGWPLLPAYNFSATMASTCSTYRFGPVLSPKSLANENLPRITVSIFDDRHELEAHNFKTAQHIDKRLSELSSTINALQNGINQTWGHHPKGFFCNLGRTWANDINDVRKNAYCPLF